MKSNVVDASVTASRAEHGTASGVWARYGMAVLVGGALAGILDAVDAVVAFKLVLGFDPVPIYQFVASGWLGPSAFAGGLATAALGVAFHFLIAFTAAAIYVASWSRIGWVTRHTIASGLAFGVGVWAVMSFLVIPLSRIPPSPFSLPLLVNGIVGHALFVGLPIAWAARRWLAAERDRVAKR